MSPRQAALAFLLRQPGVLAIPKASVLRHVEENAAAAALVLDGEDVKRIEEAHPRGPWRGLATA